MAERVVLIVDDDIRNVFALTGALESHEMEVVYATNGREGIELLERTDDVDIVLMDIMMPELDGYEATREIKRLAGDTARQASSPEVKELRAEAAALKEALADVTLENRLLKKSMIADGDDDA